jgi:beta-fructofuranosidase
MFGGVLAALALVVSAIPTRAAALPTGPAAVQTLPPSTRMMPPYPFHAKEFAFIKEGAYFHIFWMKSDPSVVIDSTERELGHATSRDLVHWTQLPPVIQFRPSKWDNFHIWAPTIIKNNGTFYMYYTGISHVPNSNNTFQRIGLATSTDLLNWTRTDQPVLAGSMIPWVYSDSSTFAGCNFRDPFAMPDPNVPGRTLIYYVGTPAGATSQLIIGLAQTTNMTSVSDLMPLWCSDEAHYWGWCESPHVLVHNGLYYLFTTTVSGHVLNFRTAASPTADSTAWSGKYRVWDMAGQDPASDAWFGSEGLSTGGHDYFATINSIGYWIDFYEISWSATAPNFSFITPVITADVENEGAPKTLDFARIPPAGSGPGMMFRATLPAASNARVALYDVGGRRLRTLQDGPLPAGETVVAWDGALDGGGTAMSGVYFAALETPLGRRVARVPVIR